MEIIIIILCFRKWNRIYLFSKNLNLCSNLKKKRTFSPHIVVLVKLNTGQEFEQFGTNATPPASKDGVFNCSKQLWLTVDSGAPSRMARSSTVHCQWELHRTVENRSLLAGGVAFDILWCWKDDHLQTSEYSLQDKYKGEVTNTTENVLIHRLFSIHAPWVISESLDSAAICRPPRVDHQG